MKVKNTPRYSYIAIFLLFSSIGYGCIGNSSSSLNNFVNGFRLLIGPSDVTFDSSPKRLGYASNFTAGTVSVFDVRNRNVLDTDDFDGSETPLTIGGNPSFIVNWTSDNFPSDVSYRLIAIDQKNSRLFAYDVLKTSTQSITTGHRELPLGAATTLAGTPVFVNTGRSSNPVFTNVTITSGDTVTENWEVKSESDDRWTVEGSVSGKQNAKAFSGTKYISDGGEIRFTILEGDRNTTSGDRFLFGTAVLHPLPLPGTPSSAFIDGDTLYLGNRDSGQIEVLDLLTMTFSTPISLDDGSSMAILPSDINGDSDNLVVSNLGEGNSAFIIEMPAQTVSAIDVGFKTQRVIVNSAVSEAFLIPTSEPTIFTVNIADKALIESPITFSTQPLAGIPLSGDEGVDGDAIVATLNNTLELVNLASKTRIDTDEGGDTESFASNIFFVDSGLESDPSIAEVITTDGQTRTESWVLTFEGVVDNSPSITGMTIDATLFDASATFSTSNIKAGDMVVLFPDNPSKTEEILIGAITDDTSIELVASPSLQSSDIPYVVRVVDSYTVFGSLSNFQTTRFSEGASAASDNQEITLSITGSSLKPTTQEDRFSFSTADGITPIALNGELPVDVALFEGVAYILNKSSSNVSAVDIANLRLLSDVD
jgi:hypothetical protein